MVADPCTRTRPSIMPTKPSFDEGINFDALGQMPPLKLLTFNRLLSKMTVIDSLTNDTHTRNLIPNLKIPVN